MMAEMGAKLLDPIEAGPCRFQIVPAFLLTS